MIGISGRLFPGVPILALHDSHSINSEKERNCINKIKNIVSLINIDLFLQFLYENLVC
jgi:hypothetical protein